MAYHPRMTPPARLRRHPAAGFPFARAVAVAGMVALVAFPPGLCAQDTPESAKAKQDVLWAQMEDSIRVIAKGTDAVVGVAILDLTDRRAFALNSDAVYPTASTIKLAVLAELFRQHATGSGARLTDPYTVDAKDAIPESDILGGLTPGVTKLTNRDLATMMIAVSDNGATNLLIDRVGMEKVNAMLDGLGLRVTRLRRRMLDVKAAQAGRENTASPRELVVLLDALYAGKVLGTKPATDEFFAMLATGKMSYLPQLLPDGVRVANKPGWLDAVRSDAGIVFVPNRPFAIAVMTTFGRDHRQQEMAIARIGRAAYAYFDRVGSSSALGRIIR
jgi:beta-lactamase class A